MIPHGTQIPISPKVAAKSFLKLEAAPLTLGVMCTIGPLRFVGFLNDFREQHPGIEVSVSKTSPDAFPSCFWPARSTLP
jgi:hypothetical protein